MHIWYSIRNKLILFFLIIIMIVSLMITIVMYRESAQLLGEKKGDSIINGLLQTSRVIDSILEDAEYQLTALTTDSENFEMLKNYVRKNDISEDPDADKIWSRIYNLRISNRNIDSIYIYSYNQKVMFTSYEGRRVINVVNPEYYQWLNIPVNEDKNSSGWLASFGIPSNISTPTGKVFLLKKLIKDIHYQEPLGESCIAITENYMRFTLLQSIQEGENGSVYLLDSKGSVISSINNKNNLQEAGEQSFYITIKKSEYGFFVDEIDNERMLIGYVTSDLTGWKYVSMIPFDEIILNVSQLKNLALFVNFIAIGLAIFLAILFSQSIYSPIRDLKESMKLAGSGNLKARIEKSRKDEFGMLNQGFNQMINRIQKLMDELFHEKLLVKEAELKSMEAQINPHFLYNTLDSIHWMARLNKTEELSQITFSLSNFYRLSLGGGKETVTTKETINLIEEYLAIQKMRYGDKFDADLEVDENLLNYYVLRLIIQPLVENAICHGVEKMTAHGHIQVILKPFGPDMVFIIKDNGIGMSKEKLDEIIGSLNQDTVEPGENFALINIHKRIQLYYGKEYGLQIESMENQGTEVRVILPERLYPGRGEQSDVQNFDS